MKRIVCLIDSLGSGGAQKQLVELAVGLKGRGYEVEFAVYHSEHDFYLGRLKSEGIQVHYLKKEASWKAAFVLSLRSFLRNQNFDVAIGFLDGPSFYLEVCRLLKSRCRIIISERSSYMNDRDPIGGRLRRNMHRMADAVIVNSYHHEAWLQNHHPWLKSKLSVVYNGVADCYFSGLDVVSNPGRSLRLISIGRAGSEKNVINIIRALGVFLERNGWVPSLSWVGRRPKESEKEQKYLSEVDILLSQAPEIRDKWNWVGESSQVSSLLRDHHCLIHASFYEGLPNVICEALAAGRPVLASAVCDHPRLIGGGKRGFVFDPNDPLSIALALERLLALQDQAWLRMSEGARSYAASELAMDRMINLFCDRIESVGRVKN